VRVFVGLLNEVLNFNGHFYVAADTCLLHQRIIRSNSINLHGKAKTIAILARYPGNRRKATNYLARFIL